MEFKSGDTAYLENFHSCNSYSCELFKVQIQHMSHNGQQALVKVFKADGYDREELRIVETRFLKTKRVYSRDKNEFEVGDMIVHRVDNQTFMGPVTKVNPQTVNYLDTSSGHVGRASKSCVMVLSKVR